MGISREQALECFRSDDLIGLGMEADAVRRRMHPEGVVGYVVEGQVDCAAAAGMGGGVSVCAAVAELVDRGAKAVRLADCGGLVQSETQLREIRRRFPALWIEGVSAAGAIALAGEAGTGVRDTLVRLVDAGMDGLSPEGMSLADAGDSDIAAWVGVHRTAHSLRMQTVAGFTFGAGETPEQCVDFLEAVGRVQQETGGFAALAVSAAPSPNGRALDGVTAVERLKTLAVARIFLDGIENVQATDASTDLKVLQMELRFGANDVGVITPSPGREEDVRRIVRDAGFRPVQREQGYRAMAI